MRIMAESPSATWTAEAGEQADNSVFKYAAIDEVASKFNNNNDLLQNTTAYLIIQHDPSIRVTRIVPSCGAMGGAQRPKTVVRAQEDIYKFYSGANTYDLKFIPQVGSVDGFWWFEPPATKDFNAAGTPAKVIAGRKITVDVDGFGGKPCMAMLQYSAEFKQYAWYPPTTSFEDSSVTWPVSFTVFYERVS